MDRIQGFRDFPSDCTPPEAIYNSRDELHAAINAWAAPRGYAFVVGKSMKKASFKRHVVHFCCDRGAGRTPTASRIRQRETTTRRTGCQFSILAKEDVTTRTWAVVHRKGVEFNTHNHEASITKGAHPVHRQLSTTDTALVQGMANAGVAPKEIRSFLRTQSDSLATQQDIYNCIAKGKRDLVQGQNNIHALANELDKDGFWSRIQLNTDNRVTEVLFAHPKSIAYLRSYPDILILDCTYKTNRYKMPLLDMVGVDASQRSFCIAFAFLSGEEEANYVWALERLRSLYEVCGAKLPSVILTDRCLACMNAIQICFPQAASLLCIWHVNKAVLRHCLPSFSSGADDNEGNTAWKEFYGNWHGIISSFTSEEYNEAIKTFKKQYLPTYIDNVGYIMSNWLDPYKEKLVKAWVDQHHHFANTATSRGEGIHYLVKSQIKSSQLDLFDAWRFIKLAIINQISELEANQASQQINIPIELSGILYSQVRGWISHEALRKVEQQRKRLSQGCPPCTGTFTKTMGLPCAHMLDSIIQQAKPLELNHFHTHWHLQRAGNYKVMMEPLRRVDNISRASTQPKTSTQREPSAFEAIERSVQPRPPPKCSVCGQRGHTRASAKCPLRYAHLLQSSTSQPAAVTALGPSQATAAFTASTPSPQPTILRDTFPSPQPAVFRGTTPSPQPAVRIQGYNAITAAGCFYGLNAVTAAGCI